MLQGNSGKHFNFLQLYVKAAVRGKDLARALMKNSIRKSVSETALSLIISALNDNTLRTVPECQTAKGIKRVRALRYW